MAEQDEGTVVVLDGDPPETIVVEEPAAKPKPTASAEDAVESLKKQLADKSAEAVASREEADRNRQAAIQAENRAREAGGQVTEAVKVAQSRELDSVSNALGAASRELEALQFKLQQAHEAGEFGTIAKLSGEIAKQGARIAQLEDGKTALEARAKETPRQAPAATVEESRERFLAGRTAPTATWIRAHPQFFTDPAFKQKVESADGYVANILGIGRDTPEYFAKIEETVGLRQAAASTAATVIERTSDEPVKEPAKSTAKPTVAAPPSRTVQTSRPEQNQNGVKVSLSAEERAAAQWLHPRMKPDDPDPEVVYARNKHALIQEGRLLGTDGRPTGRVN